MKETFNMSQAPVRQAYTRLVERFTQIINLDNIGQILSKDMETAMAPGSINDRTAQMMALATTSHGLLVAPEVENWMETVHQNNGEGLSPDENRNFELMRNRWIHATCLPEELVSEVAKLESKGTHLHTESGKKGDWTVMKAWYEYSFKTMRAVAEAKQQKLGTATPYEALLDSFSPGLKDDVVVSVFGALEKELPSLVADAVAHQKTQPAPIPLSGTFSRAQQEELCRRVCAAVGLDFNRGSLAVIDGHPSMAGSRDDARITTSYTENDFLSSLYAAVHETGHAMYEQNTPAEWNYQPAGQNMGMSVHESQSRIIEVQACHTKEFFQYLEPLAREVFNRPDDPALSAENLERLVNRVQPSFIRIEADEVTYPAHVILRHKLEKALVNGTMSIDDLPQAWNDGMQKMLGITPPDYAKGCLQDVHWPCGLSGYFPAYTLGDMGAAQFFSAACKQRPEIKAEIGKGNFTPLREWLRDNVHGKGSLLTNEELFKQATGEPLNAKAYLAHLRERYTDSSRKPQSPDLNK